MAERKSVVIVNLSSLAVLFPLPYMPIYNAAKSALSSLTHSLMLEYDEFPRFIDFRLGDVRTSFNRSSLKQSSKDQSARMKSAWMQIERQPKIPQNLKFRKKDSEIDKWRSKKALFTAAVSFRQR